MIPLYFEKISMYERRQEPCTIAIPFPQGELTDPHGVAVYDGEAALPTQSRMTASWPDGSVKWVLSHFLADLPANQSKQLSARLQTGSSVKPAVPVQLRTEDGRLIIDTGELEAVLCAPGETGLFRRVQARSFAFAIEQPEGPAIRDSEGREYVCEIGPEGWKVLEEGPIRTVAQAQGKHARGDGQHWFDFIVRVYAFAGKPWLRVDYQILHKEEAREETVTGLALRFRNPANSAAPEDIRLGMGQSNYRTRFLQGGRGERLSHCITAEELKFESNEHIPETFYGTFWSDWNVPGQGGVAVTMYQAQQNFPKSLEVSEEGLNVGIIPEGSSIVMLQGMAKTHRLYIQLHDDSETLEDINVRSLQFQLPDRPVLAPEIYERAGVFESFLVENSHSAVERALIGMADARIRAYGLLHWGDAPDPGYSEQGRGNGDWVWTNNEYDFPHAAMLLYARTGVRRFMDYVLVSAEHWLDVDICHYSDDPLRYQGQIMHSAKHVTESAKICHQWVEGLLDYYHLTGEPHVLEAAVGIGENVMRIFDTPRYKKEGGINARESGWALRSLGALYKETHDERWLTACDAIVEHFAAWKQKYGAWLSPYTDHAAVRVTFMIAVAANSLMRYYRIRPQERIRTMIIEAMDDLLEHAYFETEKVFYYKELPSLQRLNTNPIILEALSYAYEFSGDTKYLDAGLETFRMAIEGGGMGGGGRKQISGDAVIVWGGAGPKRFAQYYFPIFTFYRTASKAGLL